MLDHDLQALLSLDGDAGPARAIAPAHAEAIARAALAGAGFGPGGGGGGGARAARPVWVKLVLGGLGLAVIAGVALFASMSHPRSPVLVLVPVLVPDPSTSTSMGTSTSTSTSTSTENTAGSGSGTGTGTGTGVEPDEVEMPAIDARPMTKHEAEDLLAKANAARGAHHWKTADALYTRVASGAPRKETSLAAQTALVASASLHLEHLGDVRGAARKYRTALRAGGPLAEDARWGLALALRGNPVAEAKALDDFLAHHPTSALAPEAKNRRAALP